MGAEEPLQRVVNGGAAFGRTGRGIDRIERLQLQDAARIDRVGVAQPGFDFRYPQLTRPYLHRWARGRRLGPLCAWQLVEPARETKQIVARLKPRVELKAL